MSITHAKRLLASVIAAVAPAICITASAGDDDLESLSNSGTYEITVTNVTRGQQFTPILVASHRANVKLFELGTPASAGLQTLAEEGNVVPLTEALKATSGVLEVTNSGALLNPGASVKVRVRAGGAFSRISVASMLIPTNDGFFAVNAASIPHGREVRALTSVAYDAGSERNDELCASIPGPFFAECGGPGGGGAPSGGEEGYVHVHAGIHGIGDIDASQRDWRNPVARITVQRVR
jgi:hypothetical protein